MILKYPNIPTSSSAFNGSPWNSLEKNSWLENTFHNDP